MSTGACGINCDVCKLNLLGICSTCGSGINEDGLKKKAAQERILGKPCPVLSCAIKRLIEYCPRDCERFPCIEFTSGPYPFSSGYLDMQKRRRTKKPPLVSPSGSALDVPKKYWEDIKKRDIEKICKNSMAISFPPRGIFLPFLKESLFLDIQKHCLIWQAQGQWKRIDNPLLELLSLVYLLKAGCEPISQEIIGIQELKSAHFFRGPHELKTKPILARYGNDPDGFKMAAKSIGGEPLDLADISYQFFTFPKVPLYYLFWVGDHEFPPTLSILFDRSVESHLSADAIWGLVSLVSNFLLKGSFLK
ncbi:MAG: DUF3786 domain-containing protein [Thermodesulfobacteriota bacterium]|nr:DUF3786 domain-containing protein [Thermodesulfobacteriota bacterium]